MWDPAGAAPSRWQFAALRNSDSNRHLGSEPAGDTWRPTVWSPLWPEPGREFQFGGLTYTDILSGWTEGVGRCGTSGGGRRAGTAPREVEERFAFCLVGLLIQTTVGSFSIITYTPTMVERKAAVDFTRSRPYHSDDNAHVGAKRTGDSWARQLLAYGRLEDPRVGGAHCYSHREVWAPWQNLFCPV